MKTECTVSNWIGKLLAMIKKMTKIRANTLNYQKFKIFKFKLVYTKFLYSYMNVE